MSKADTTTTTDGGRSGKRSQRLLWPRLTKPLPLPLVTKKGSSAAAERGSRDRALSHGRFGDGARPLPLLSAMEDEVRPPRGAAMAALRLCDRG